MYEFLVYNIFMKTKRRPGRPPKSSGKLKSESVLIRVEASEKAAFERAAEVAGTSLSSWARERLRIAALRELDNVGEQAQFMQGNRNE